MLDNGGDVGDDHDSCKKHVRRTITVLPHGDNDYAVHDGCLDQDVGDDHDDAQANNNRLANYIDKVRQLQTENRRMTKQIQVKTIFTKCGTSWYKLGNCRGSSI